MWRCLCGIFWLGWFIIYGCQDVRELRHLCGIFWSGWLMDVGRYEGVTPSMWAFPAWFWRMGGSCAIYVPKRQLDVEKKKHLGENSAEDCKKLVIFRDTWRNWPVLNGSWAIYPPHSAFDIDGATQDSERLLWHQSRTFQQKTGHPKWSISFYIALKKWVFQAHRRVPPTTGVVELWKKLFCNENQWNWVVFLKSWWVFSLGTYILCM